MALKIVWGLGSGAKRDKTDLGLKPQTSLQELTLLSFGAYALGHYDLGLMGLKPRHAACFGPFFPAWLGFF